MATITTAATTTSSAGNGGYCIEGDYYDDDDDDDDDDYYDDDDDEYGGGHLYRSGEPTLPVGAAAAGGGGRFHAPLQRPAWPAAAAAAAAATAAGSTGGVGGSVWSALQQQQQQQQQQKQPTAQTLARLQLQEAIRSRCDRPDELVGRLVAGGQLDLGQPLKDGWTALMLAAERCHGDMVAALVRHGARADWVSPDDGATCLMAACGNRHCEEAPVLAIVDQLMACGGADTLHTVASRHGSALHLAARSNYPGVIARLLAAGASADCPAGPHGRTPLMEAAARGNLRAVQALLAGTAPARDRRDRRGHTAAELAANAGYARVARLIDADVGPGLAEQPAAGPGGDDGDDDYGDATTRAGVVADAGEGESGKLDDLTSFFYGIGYPEVAQQFRAHDLTFLDLLTTTEATLDRIGVRKVGARRRILEAVRQLHRRPWRDASMPQVATGRPPTPGDYLAILANAHRHLEIMNATLRYLTEHANAIAADAEVDAAAAAAADAAAPAPAAAADADDANAAANADEGMRNPRVLARARNSCRLAAGECRRMLGRLDATLAALCRLQPADRPVQLPPAATTAANVRLPGKLGVAWPAAGGAAVVAVAAIAVSAFVVFRR